MLFTTDKQTLDDLNIFGKHQGDSIYSIYNQTHTRAGAIILADLFNFPLSEEQAINRRSKIIQYFAGEQIGFPFLHTQFDAIEPYMDNTDERTKLSAQEHSVGQKISNLIAIDIDTAAIYKGVEMLAEWLKSLHRFLSALSLENGHPYQPDRDAMLAILADPAFETIISAPEASKWPKKILAEFDLLFRFRNREAIKNLLRYTAYLDVYTSVAQVALKHNFVFPTALPAGMHLMEIEDVYHPQVENAVPNSIRITPDRNVIFLTGANMAGKSTFMKSISTALFLAHMGFPVAAKKMNFSVLDGIYTTINLPDNLGMGASHFYSEVLRAKKVALELKSKNLFVLFDELFRGTNVKDACEATIAFTEAFARKRNSIFVISTHIIEAGEVLKTSCNNIDFIFLPTRMEGNKPIYTYTLESGITEDRHGMIIINNEGILDILQSGLQKLKIT